jgi:acetate kinase
MTSDIRVSTRGSDENVPANSSPAMAGSLLLAINAGSSSLKISLFTLTKTQDNGDEPVSLTLTSSISAISSPPAKFAFQIVSNPCSEIKEQVETIKDHASAFAHFLTCLKHHASIDKHQIINVCHRVVHGGGFSDPILISEDTYHHIENLSDLAPLYAPKSFSRL